MSIKQAAEGLIKKGDVSDGVLNMVEMAFRAYDPCYGCATHTLPGQMPLDIKIYDNQGMIVRQLKRP
jgi:F420-non-reducing hydrogenase large subunit